MRFDRFPWKNCAIDIAGALKLRTFGYALVLVPAWRKFRRPWRFWISRDGTPMRAVLCLGPRDWGPPAPEDR